MALLGQAVMIVWNDVSVPDRSAFYKWHNREHMPERLAIPGFRVGRKYRVVRGKPAFCNFYEVDAFSTLVGDDYRARQENPTPATRDAGRFLANPTRALAYVRHTIGTGMGGHLLTVRFDAPDLRRVAILDVLRDAAGRMIASAEIVGVHVLESDRAASSMVTEEKKNRPPIRVPGWVLLVEGISTEAVDRAFDLHLSEDAFKNAGATEPIARGVYALENIIFNEH